MQVKVEITMLWENGFKWNFPNNFLYVLDLDAVNKDCHCFGPVSVQIIQFIDVPTYNFSNSWDFTNPRWIFFIFV